MIHYESNEKEIIKYDIEIDSEKLSNIKKDILEKFTEAIRVCSTRGRGGFVCHVLPSLGCLIDSLMDGDFEVISELKSPQISTIKENLENRINGMLPIEPTTDFNQLISSIQEYKEYVSLNENRLDFLNWATIRSYYSKVLGCVKITEISRTPVQNFDQVADFFKGELQDVLDELAQMKKESEEEELGEISDGQVGAVQKKIGSC